MIFLQLSSVAFCHERTKADADTSELPEASNTAVGSATNSSNPFSQPVVDIPHHLSEYERASDLLRKNFPPLSASINSLEKKGVNLFLSYTSDIVGNPVGGKNPNGCAYADVWNLGLLLETEKLVQWPGGFLRVSALQFDGTNLSDTNIRNWFLVQETYGGTQTIVFGELSYEQKFFNDHASLKLGRILAGNDFAFSPLYLLYMNGAIDCNPEALWINGNLSSYVNYVWGSRLKIDLSQSTTAQVGVYQVTQVSYHGLNWNIYPNDGVMLVAQYGWQPEWDHFLFSQPAEKKRPTPPEQAGTSLYGPPSFAISSSKNFPGHYWMGGYYSS